METLGSTQLLPVLQEISQSMPGAMFCDLSAIRLDFWEAGTIIPHFTDEETELYKLNLEHGYLARKGTGVDLSCVTPKSGLLTSIPCCYDEE